MINRRTIRRQRHRVGTTVKYSDIYWIRIRSTPTSRTASWPPECDAGSAARGRWSRNASSRGKPLCVGRVDLFPGPTPHGRFPGAKVYRPVDAKIVTIGFGSIAPIRRPKHRAFDQLFAWLGLAIFKRSLCRFLQCGCYDELRLLCP